MYKSLIFICEKYKINEVIFGGGVSASKYINKELSEKLKKEKIKAYFTTLGKDMAEAKAQKDKLAEALKPVMA